MITRNIRDETIGRANFLISNTTVKFARTSIEFLPIFLEVLI